MTSGAAAVVELGSGATINATGGALVLGAAGTAVTVSGTMTVTQALTATASLVITGADGSNKLTVTAGDVSVANGSVTIVDGDNANSLSITNNTITTGTLVQLNSSSLTSGVFLDIRSDESELNGGYFLRCYQTDGSSTKFTIGENGATVIAGNATGTDAFTVTAGDVVFSDGDLTLTQSADAAALTIVADANTANIVVDINADGLTSGTILHLDSSTAGWTTGLYLDCFDGAASEFSVGLDGAVIITNSAATTTALQIVANSATTATAGIINIDANALTTGNVIKVDSTSVAIAAGELLNIDLLSNGNLAAKTGNLCSITSSMTMTTASQTEDYDALLISRSDISNNGGFTLTSTGSTLKLLHTSTQTAGTLADSSVVLEIEASGTTGYTGNIVQITGVAVASRAVNIVSACTTVSDFLITGSGVKADNKAILEIAGTGATAAGGSLFRVAQSSGTPAAATSYLVDFDYTGMTSTNNPVAVIMQSAGTAAVLQLTSAGAMAGGTLELISTNAGALGPVIKTYHNSGVSTADNDVIFRFDIFGDDDGPAAQEYAKIDCVATDVSAGTEDADLNFYVARGGTVTKSLAIDSDLNGILVGDGAAAAYISSSGAYDLIVETNSGTNSGTIQIVDGANGDIVITPNGTGQLQLFAPSYGQITALADGAALLTVAQCGLCTMGNTAGRAVTLPAVATSAGVWYTIKKTSVNAAAITITPADGTIDGAATYAGIDAQYDVATIVCDGSNWHIVSREIAP